MMRGIATRVVSGLTRVPTRVNQALRDAVIAVAGERDPPTLPQDDSASEDRLRRLQAARRQYTYLDAPGENRLAAPTFTIAKAGRFSLLAEVRDWRWIVGVVPNSARAVFHVYYRQLRYQIARLRRPPDLMQAYRSLYSERLQLKYDEKFVAQSTEDRFFARERLDGPNPYVIARADRTRLFEVLDTCAIGDDERKAVVAQLEAAALAKRLYIADFKLLADARHPANTALQIKPGQTQWAVQPTFNRDSRWRGKYLPAPVAFFEAVDTRTGQRELTPLAIQLEQKGAANNRVFTAPRSPQQHASKGWLLAKFFVRVADANHHEHGAHNTRHHFLAEAFVLATRRQLSRRHPVHVLLEPHLAWTLIANWFIYRFVTTRGSGPDMSFAGTLATQRRIMTATRNVLPWPAHELEADLRSRGLEDATTDRLDFPFREDAREWVTVIGQFVNTYVREFYRDDAAVQNDFELQAWRCELTDPSRGALVGIPTLDSIESLSGLLAQLLFLVGPGHAAAHYVLPLYVAWIPAYPRASFMPLPRAEKIKRRHLHGMLPSFEAALPQFRAAQMANYLHYPFGDYRYFRLGTLARAANARGILAEGIRGLRCEVQRRNQARAASARAYPFLDPDRVPSNIHI